MTSTKPRLTRIADRPGEGLAAKPLQTFRVSVDGVEIGTVGQMRASTMHAYSGRSYGYATTRLAWYWESDDNAGDYEIATRAAAVRDLVDFVEA